MPWLGSCKGVTGHRPYTAIPAHLPRLLPKTWWSPMPSPRLALYDTLQLQDLQRVISRLCNACVSTSKDPRWPILPGWVCTSRSIDLHKRPV